MAELGRDGMTERMSTNDMSSNETNRIEHSTVGWMDAQIDRYELKREIRKWT